MQQITIYIKTFIEQVFLDHFSLKALFSFIWAIMTFLYAGLSSDALVSLLILIVLDFILGVWEAKKHKKMIESSKAYKTPVKILVYFAMIASGHLVENGLPQTLKYIDDTILVFLLLTEFLSILKHFSNLGYETPTRLINNLTEKKEEKSNS